MPHLHLPIDHTEADLVLAANLAEIVGSEDLYVAWSHESRRGRDPEVEAVVRTERERAVRRVRRGRRRLLAGLLGRPDRRESWSPRHERAGAERPYAD